MDDNIRATLDRYETQGWDLPVHEARGLISSLQQELAQLRAEREGLDNEMQSRIDTYNGKMQNLFYIVRACCEAYEDAKAGFAEVENLKGDRDTMHPDKQKALFKFREAEKVGALQWPHLWELVQRQDDIITTLKSKLTRTEPQQTESGV